MRTRIHDSLAMTPAALRAAGGGVVPRQGPSGASIR